MNTVSRKRPDTRFLYRTCAGFRMGKTTKTLALLMENRTLVLSFYNGECMIFWKEWLRDVCGRSEYQQ